MKREQRRTAKIEAATAARVAVTNEAKQLAAKRKASPYSVEKMQGIIDRMREYEEQTIRSGKPLTIAGYQLAANIPMATWYEMKNGNYDHYVEEYKLLYGIPEDADEYIDDNGEPHTLEPYSEIIQKAYLRTQEQRETACSSLRGNPAGNIFLLKSQNGLREDTAPAVQHNTLVIASADKAREALEMLK